MGGQLARHRLEQRIAGGVAVLIVDRLEAVEIDIKQRRRRAVALDISQRALQLALEAAPVEDIEQRVDVGARLKLGDAGASLVQLALEALDLGAQQRGRREVAACHASLRPIGAHNSPRSLGESQTAPCRSIARADQSWMVLTVRFSISPRSLA